MKFFYLILVLFLSSYFSFAQYENLDLSKYKLPDITRHKLDVSFGSYGVSENNDDIGWYNSVAKAYENSTKRFNCNGNLSYSFYKNSEKLQLEAFARTYQCVNMFKSYIEAEDSREKTSDLYNYSTATFNVLYFPGSKNWFLAFRPSAYVNYGSKKDRIEDEKTKSTYFSGKLGVGGGKGRIEQVQDFRQSVLLLQELEKRGVAKRILTEQEVFNLTSLISELKNKRVFDARKRKIADLTAVDSFLVANDVVDETKGIDYFVGLEDIWDFGSQQTRESGNQLKILSRPGYFYQKNEDDTDLFKVKTFSFNSYITYKIRKPLSIKWQSDYDFGIDHSYTDVLSEEGGDYFDYKHQCNAYVSADLGFYPNTRTRVSLGGQVSLGNTSSDKLLDDERYRYSWDIATSAYYYISERLRLTAAVSYDASAFGILNEDVANDKSSSFWYNLGINYAIF